MTSSSSTPPLPSVSIPPGALLFQRAVTNQIGVTAASSNNIGYLATNSTQLEVVSELTGQDPTDIYNFTYQNSGPVKLTATVLQGDALPRITLTDATGTSIIADSGGNTQQQAAYQKLISSTGLDLSAGAYAIKITYPTGGSKINPNDFTLQLSSGTTFKNDYRALASPTTIQDTLLAGGGLGYNPLTATASMLTSISNGTGVDIFGTLSLFGTNPFDIFA
jgi:hypothetical protein